ncbi:MAG: hypothetical protein HY744_11935 [Deltaproteobacteria bacterium]|nr:hypothetical protein [Deltaproteobacteria bacterium]
MEPARAWQASPAPRSRGRPALLGPWLVFAACCSACGGRAGLPLEPDFGFLTVDEVWQQAEGIEGQQIRVRGWRMTSIIITRMGCEPMRCDCNYGEGGLGLASKPVSVPGPEQVIGISDVECSRDECSVRCSPFDPYTAAAFEMVGALRLSRNVQGEVSGMALDDIDLAASSELAGGTDLATMSASPLRLGQATCTCPSSTWLDDCWDAGESLTCTVP